MVDLYDQETAEIVAMQVTRFFPRSVPTEHRTTTGRFTGAALIFSALSTLAGAAGGQDGAAYGVPAKVIRYADILLVRYDLNRDSVLQEEEWQKMAGEPAAIDRDQDGIITRNEIQSHLADFARSRLPQRTFEPTGDPSLVDVTTGDSGQPNEATAPTAAADPTAAPGVQQRDTKFVVRPSRGLSKLPAWFLSRDADGDGQLTLREFTADAPGRSREFEKLDQNGDGVITPREATTVRSTTGGPTS